MTLLRPAAGLLALSLVIAGCGGDSKEGPGTAATSAAQGGAAPAGASTPKAVNGVRPGAEKGSSLDGTWLARTGGQRVALHLFRGAAALNSPAFCSGTIDKAARIKMTCANGNGPRAEGRAALRGRTLVVTWEGGAKDAFRRG
ncbi:hypothetical protein ACFVH6_00170 [Spirillospora sp. NPDC127200]